MTKTTPSDPVSKGAYLLQTNMSKSGRHNDHQDAYSMRGRLARLKIDLVKKI